MCGIAGYFSPSGVYNADIVSRMSSALSLRGPDDAGEWIDSDAGIALGHRRLAILDVSAAGAQPMVSHSGRYVIVFNGEIYNHRALRKRLEADSRPLEWRGHADTETLLVAIETLGLQKTLVAADGMFALALWDRQERELTLARDRFGEKPLYYGFSRGVFLFGSELKALFQHPNWRGELATGAIESYLRFGCVGGEQCIFQGIHKLLPGTVLHLPLRDIGSGLLPDAKTWWSVERAAADAKQAEPLSKVDDAVNAVEQSLGASVAARMVADVPLGAFLSGGVDSSLIVALMQQHASSPMRTFSVGFDDARYDESGHAAAVAAHLGTSHTTLQTSSQMALDLVPRLPEFYDEPFADSSQLPTALICRLIRQHVTVALSGDGGDELFGGYNRHVWVPRLWRKMRSLPRPARRALAATLKAIPSHSYDQLMRRLGGALPSRLRLRTFGEKVHKLAAALGSESERDLFARVACMNPNSATLQRGGSQQDASDAIHLALTAFQGVEWMLLMDTLHYMVDDVLVKVDRASMASSLEVRVPFLNPEVFNTAWRISASLKLRKGHGKWVLRQLLYKHVPQSLIDRPKMGFAIPLDDWLRGPLNDWADDLLSSQRLHHLPMVDGQATQRLWRAHLKGSGHHAQQLWTVLQLVAWQRHWRTHTSV
tara:strand:- start:4263 stop:6230 length:1968 start_codon:yes stop_codon:yes gene_type:complete